MEKQNVNILYVDDEMGNLTGFTAFFRRYYTVFTAISAKEAKVILSKNEIHVLITDQRMPETVGTKLLELCMREYPEPTRILLTGYADNETIIDAFQKGLMCKYILKPYNADELKEVIDASYKVYKLNRIKEGLYKEWVKMQGKVTILKNKNEH
jgi:DNA-binding NtrC family response regulator